MKDLALAQWLEHCAEYIALLEDRLSAAIFEGVLQMAATGSADMLDSILAAAAHNAVAAEQPLDNSLALLQTVKLVIWHRVEAEIDPDPAWDMLVRLELIFQTALLSLTRHYLAARADLHRRQTADAVRLGREAEQKVMAYATQLARANRELTRLEKAKTDFISIAAHELKTPLTIMQGYVDMLLENADGAPETADTLLLKGLASGTERLTAIVDALLDVSAIETGTLALHPETTSMQSVAHAVVEQVSPAIEARRQQLQVDIAPHLPPLTTDPKRLYQVLERLLFNAIKYTPDGGTITLRIRAEDTPAGEAGSIKIEIADTGIGIAPEDRDHIFDKFYRVGETDRHSSGRVKFKGAGPGLGLPIARGLVEALGGKIWVESPGYDEVNCPGSTFHIRLPVNANLQT